MHTRQPNPNPNPAPWSTSHSGGKNLSGLDSRGFLYVAGWPLKLISALPHSSGLLRGYAANLPSVHYQNGILGNREAIDHVIFACSMRNS